MTAAPLTPEDERDLRYDDEKEGNGVARRIWATLDAARARIAELEGTAQEVQSFAENYKRERDEARAEMRRWKIELAPELCGGTDYWDSHTPREVAAEALRLRNETIDAITGIQKREIARMRPVVEAAMVVAREAAGKSVAGTLVEHIAQLAIAVDAYRAGEQP